MKKQRKFSPDIVSAAVPGYSVLAAQVVRNGGVIAIPTETYYGLAANPFEEKALKRIYQIKRRPAEKPILVLIEKTEQLSLLVESIPESYMPLIEQWWPGPLTLIFRALPGISKILTGNTGTVGVRLTSCKTAQEICRASGGPITATSANLSGEKAATSSSEVRAAFGNQIDLIVDDGESGAATGSTIVGLQGGKPFIIRSGVLNLKF